MEFTLVQEGLTPLTEVEMMHLVDVVDNFFAECVGIRPMRFDRGLGLEDGAADGGRVVSAGDARDRDRRERGEGDAAREGIADGAHRYGAAQGAWAAEQVGGAADRAARQDQCARDRRAGVGRVVDGARREDLGLPDAVGTTDHDADVGGELRGDVDEGLDVHEILLGSLVGLVILS